MKTRTLIQEICIVVLGSINKEQCNPLRLAKLNVISEDEVHSIENSSMIVSKDLVQFRTKGIEVVCDTERLQIRSKDVSLSNKLSFITKGIINCCICKVSAIGINAMWRVSFLSDIDFLHFCHHVAPLNGLDPLSSNALVSNITVSDWSEEKENSIPKRTFNIQRIPTFENNEAVQISMNAHYAIGTNGSTIDRTLENAASEQSLFFTNAQNLFELIK